MNKKKLYVRFKESWSGGEPVVVGDPWSEREDTVVIHDTQSLHIYAEGWDVESFEVSGNFSAGDKVYLVRVEYETGDTFGRSCGHVAYVDAFARESDAQHLAQQIRSGSYSGYKPWEGYFERMTNVMVDSFVIQD